MIPAAMKTMKKFLTASCLLLASALQAQNPAPAPPQREATLILNATAHLGDGRVIPNAAVGFENGKLTLVADATTIRIDRTRYPRVIDAAGKHVYPGLIACNSKLGLAEIDLVRASLDFNEVGELNPNVRSIIAYNTDSKIIPTVRANGVLLVEVVPEGSFMTGQSSVVQLDAWNWEDAAVRLDIGIHLNWPRMFVYRSNPEQEENQRNRMVKELTALNQLFSEAKAYAASTAPQEENVKLEAMRRLFDGSGKLFVHCDYVKEIEAAVAFSKRFGVKMVLVGGADAWRVTDLLRKEQVPVIIGRTHALPPREDDDIDLPYKLPSLLKSAGVTFALSVDGSWQLRNLPFMAGTAACYGLTKEEALTAITSSPAAILGLADRMGKLENGLDATLIIVSGDLFDMRSATVEQAFISGRNVSLDNVQKQLYQKYSDKYGLNK